MKIFKLARSFQLKYGIKSNASTKDTLVDIRRDLIDAYNNYANIDTVRSAYNILPFLAQRGEDNSKKIISYMEECAEEAKNSNPDVPKLLLNVDSLLKLINELSKDNHKEIRNKIHDFFIIRKDTDKNQREMAKSKFEQVVFHKIESLMKKKRNELNKLMGIKEFSLNEQSTIPKDLSSQDIWMFRKTPAAAHYNLDNDDIWARVWDDLEMRNKISTLVRAIKRNHIPRDGGEVLKATKEIMNWFENKQTNNEYFEASEDEAKNLENRLVDPVDINQQQAHEGKLLKQLENENEPSAEEKEYLESLVKERDDKYNLEQIEKDRERHLGKGGSLHVIEELLTRYS